MSNCGPLNASPAASNIGRWVGTAVILSLLLESCQKPVNVSNRAAERSTAATSKVEQSRPEHSKAVIHVGDVLGGGKMIHYVRPVYPERLRRRHVEGIVYFNVLVGKDGVPQRITYDKGPKELVDYAERAVKAWRYQPFAIDGHPVAFVTEAAVQFTLSQ